MEEANSTVITDFTPGEAVYFAALNKEWIQQSYRLEQSDLDLLDNPQESIISKGGAILFAKHQGEVIGTVGLLPHKAGAVEMIKLAVKPDFRGNGAGKLLCLAAIQKAAQMGASKIILYSNTLQEKAIELYRKLGFVERPVEKGVYERANIKMEYTLGQDIVPEQIQQPQNGTEHGAD